MVIKVAVDAMGGDAAPAVVVEGAVRALRASEGALDLLLFGKRDAINAELRRLEAQDLPLSVHHTDDVIEMADAPAQAVKTKTQSSIHLGLGAHKAGLAHAFVSAGNTGAVMAAALFVLGRLPGVARPSLVGFYPTTKGFSLLLDVGSNVDCKPEHLVQFAQMGSIYAERILNRDEPTVGLMNIGEERGKGNEQAKAAFELLYEASGLRFIGNLEGRDLLHHGADVVVTDGFVGNVLLKFGESITTALPVMLSQAMERLSLSADQQAIVGSVLQEMRQPFNYENYGGAPLLGVAGNVVIGHGGSTARAIEQMIYAGAELARQEVSRAIAGAMGTPVA